MDAHPELFAAGTHGFVDFSEDVSAKDIAPRSPEGYDSAELAKRFTTATMGPLQGKLETVNTVAVVAEATGTHDRRDRHHHLAAAVRADHASARSPAAPLEPVRYSPMQPWHERTARSRSSPASGSAPTTTATRRPR